MLLYLAIIYIIFRIVHFLIVHKGQNKQVLGRMLGFLILEIALVVVGIIAVAPVMFGGAGDNTALAYTMLIGGVICLIASGRVGMHIRKLAKGVSAEVPGINPTAKKQLTLAKTLTVASFLALIFAWPFYQASFKSWAALIYVTSILCAVIAVRYSVKSKKDTSIKRFSIFGPVVISCIIAILSIFMLLGLVMNV